MNDKLQRGIALLVRAGDDRDLLGAALLALHAALEETLLDALEASDTLGAEERARITRGEADMRALVTLAERHLGISRAESNAILEAESQRNRFAGGAAFDGSAERLLRYARLVAAFCGAAALLDDALAAARANPAAAASRPSPARPWWRLSGWALAQLISFFIIVGVLGAGGAWLYGQFDVPRLVGAFGTQPTAAARAPLAVPQATPLRRARIVRVGAGSGWLHESPDFASATLPLPIRDEMRVTVLDQQATGPDGTIWLNVSVGGYEGWCPAQNLELGT